MPLNKTRSISISWNAILQERQLPSVCKIMRYLWRMESFMVRTFNSRGSVIFWCSWIIRLVYNREGGGERGRICTFFSYFLWSIFGIEWGVPTERWSWLLYNTKHKTYFEEKIPTRFFHWPLSIIVNVSRDHLP